MLVEKYKYDLTLPVWDIINALVRNKKEHKETDRICLSQMTYDELIQPFMCEHELVEFIKEKSGYKSVKIVITD